MNAPSVMARPAFAAVIVAAGRGERLGAELPKQYLDLDGRPMLAHSLSAFLGHPRVGAVVCVINPEHKTFYEQCLAEVSASDSRKMLAVVAGGATRQASVLAGLEALEGAAPQSVLIHDAARPFVTAAMIDAVAEAIAPGIGAVPGRAIADTLKRTGADGTIRETVSRDRLHAVSTPQGFRFDEILAAHRATASAGIGDLTDDAAVAERAGMKVRLVACGDSNEKITTAADLEGARRRLAAAALPDLRTGNGYDVHALVPGDHVTLCGVRIAHDRALKGHSDADVGLHALTDALLATIADGDIGHHFPPSDPQWRGASSDRFLAFAAERVRARGGAITLVDVTLVCEAPEIGPHRDAMRQRIAEILGIGADRVSVKATTNEGIGFIGRREGVAAIAAATAHFSAGTRGA